MTKARALLLLMALLVMAGAWLFWDGSVRRGSVHAGHDAAHAAADSIVAIFSYQPATADATLNAAARDRLTGKFLDDYTQVIKTVVVPKAVRENITATAKVPAVAVVSADAQHATLLAYVDQSVTSGKDAPAQNNSTVRVSMDNVDGRWLISGFEPI